MPQIFQTRLHTGYSNVCVLHGIISALHFQKKAKKTKKFLKHKKHPWDNLRHTIVDKLLKFNERKFKGNFYRWKNFGLCKVFCIEKQHCY